MAVIAFDIDDCLWKIIDLGIIPNSNLHKFTQIPDYELIQILYWHLNNGDLIYIWSAGGEEYAQNWRDKYLIPHPNVMVMEKVKNYSDDEIPFMDICYDDQEVNLAKVNIRVKRESHLEEGE